MRKRSLLTLFCLALSLQSCIYAPFYHEWQQWAANSCGNRKNFFLRQCSGLVTLVTLPYGLFLLSTFDVVNSLLEGFSNGKIGKKDPLLSSVNIDYEGKSYFVEFQKEIKAFENPKEYLVSSLQYNKYWQIQ